MRVVSSHFLNNTASNHGGSLHLSDTASSIIQSSVFRHNYALEGGAFYANMGASVWAASTEFSYNQARLNGAVGVVNTIDIVRHLSYVGSREFTHRMHLKTQSRKLGTLLHHVQYIHHRELTVPG